MIGRGLVLDTVAISFVGPAVPSVREGDIAARMGMVLEGRNLGIDRFPVSSEPWTCSSRFSANSIEYQRSRTELV